MKLISKILFISIALLLTACPTQFVRMIETYQSNLDSLNRIQFRNLNYDTSLTNIDNYIRHSQKSQLSSEDLIQDSLNKATNILTTENTIDSIKKHKINIEITSIFHEHFPDSVELRAIVFDDNGNYISGLAPPFISKERNYREFWTMLNDSCDGKNYQINDFKVTEVRQTTSKPYSIAYILDHSPSMGNQRAFRLQNAVKFTLNRIKPIDYVSIIKFSRNVFREVALTNDTSIYRNQFKINGLDSGRYGDGTSIYDALAAGIEELNKSPEGYEKIIFLFTDGGDNTSKFKPDSILLALKENNIRVFSIGYGMTDVRFLNRVSNFTGGSAVQLASSREFPIVFRSLYLSLNNYYRIVYSPPNCYSKHIVTPTIEISELNTGKISTNGTYDKSILTEDLPIGSVSISYIEFEFGKSDIKDDSFFIIEQVANSLKNNPSMQVKIIGHTDDIGSDEVNLKLSIERANSVKDALIKLGINRNRLLAEGKGKHSPIVPNDSEENRRRNRRTEFVVIKN